MTLITWDNADFTWDDNPHTWDNVQLLNRAAAGEDFNTWEQKDKDKLV